MSTPVPPLTQLETFEAAARHGSFVAAADELHLSASAVSHRVRALEVFLGVSLFERFARRIELTDHGRAYLPTVRRAFDDLAASTVALFGSTSAGRRLVVRAPISYAVTVVAPELERFVDAHAGLEVRLTSAIWADALPAEVADLEVRFGDGRWPGHRAELLHDESAVAVWSPRFAAHHGPIGSVADLRTLPRARVLGLDDHPGTRPETGPSASGTPDTTVDTSLAAIALAVAGDRWTVVPERFVRRELADARLASTPDGRAPMAQAHWLVTAETSDRPSPEALLFADWLRTLPAT